MSVHYVFAPGERAHFSLTGQPVTACGRDLTEANHKLVRIEPYRHDPTDPTVLPHSGNAISCPECRVIADALIFLGA